MPRYKKAQKITKQQRLERRASRQAEKQLRQTRDVNTVKKVAEQVTDSKVQRQLEAKATRLLAEDKRRRIEEAERRRGIVHRVDPKVAEQAAAQHQAAVAAARICRRGASVWVINRYTEEVKNAEGSVITPAKPVVEFKNFDSVNQAKKYTRKFPQLPLIVLGEKEQLPAQFK